MARDLETRCSGTSADSEAVLTEGDAMKNEKLKVGDRVAVYDNAVRMVGEITFIRSEDGRVAIDQNFGTGVCRMYHQKQCRRLVKKPRREFWLSIHDCSEPRVHRYHEPKLICGSGCKIEWIHVREVRRK